MKLVRVAALLAALTLILAACTDNDPEPTLDPTPSTSPSTSDTSTPEPTRTVDPLTPVETVETWIVAHNTTFQDGSTTDVYALSTSDCTTCRDLVEPFAQLYAGGGSMETEGWIVDRSKERPDFDKNKQVIAGVTFTQGRTVLEPGEAPSPFAEERHILQFQLRHSTAGWRVSQVVFLS